MGVVATLLACCLMIYVGYVFVNGRRFAKLRCEELVPRPILPTVSIIIPARNEAQHASAIIHAALTQVYAAGKLEVIFVNDHSEDSTLAIAQVMAQQYPSLKVISLPVDQQGKKAALTAGVAAAQGEIILQTDADCSLPPRWAWSMVSHFQGRIGVVLGPVKILHQSNMWERLQTMEMIGLQALTAGGAVRRRPTMANGANMGYLRKVFERVHGYEQVDQVASGDDELLVQKFRLQTSFQLTYAKCQDAVVTTQALPSWQSFRSQRLRWVSKARAYLDRRINVIQLLSYLGFLSFPVLLVAGGWDPAYWWLGLELFLLKCLGDLFMMYYAARFFHNLPLLRYFLLLELAYIPYVIWVGVAGNMVKTYNWKDRWVT